MISFIICVLLTRKTFDKNQIICTNYSLQAVRVQNNLLILILVKDVTKICRVRNPWK